jgi:hypothetical protein
MPGRLSLAELQASMVTATTCRADVDPRLLGEIGTSRDIAAAERLAAYQANIRGAHLQALDRAYPVTREVLGPRYWQQLLEHAVPRFGSSSPDLNAYGYFLPAVLGEVQKQRPELATLPYLEELAGLEWAVHRARFVKEDRGFDWEGFEALTATGRVSISLVLSSALTVVPLRYPADDIWRSHNGDRESGNRSTGTCCVHRSGRFGVTVSSLEPHDRLLLEALSNTGIGHLLNDSDTEESSRVARQIFDWIGRGWIVGFETG